MEEKRSLLYYAARLRRGSQLGHSMDGYHDTNRVELGIWVIVRICWFVNITMCNVVGSFIVCGSNRGGPTLLH